MCSKRNLIIRLRRVVLLIKALHMNAAVPIAVLNIAFPFLLLLIYHSKGMCEELTITANRLYGLFFPPMICWCPIFVQKFYFEEAGCELLFINGSRNKTADLLWIFCFGISLELLLLTPVCFYVYGFLRYCLRLLLVTIFYFGTTYLISFLAHSITPTLLFTVVYTVMNLFSPGQTVHFPFYYSPESQPDILKCELPLSAIGVTAVAVTSFLMSKRKSI